MHLSPRSNRKWAIALVLLLACLGLVSQVEAAEGVRGDKCEVAAGVQITEDYYFLCRVLDVRGSIDGDLIGAASQITIHRGATVTGDLWVGGGKLIIEGTVGDDVHFGGLSVEISQWARFSSSKVDLFALALNADVQRDAVLPGDVLMYGYQLRIAGSVGGNVRFAGEALQVDGVVAGQVQAQVGDAGRRADVPGLPIYDVSFQNPGLWIGEGAHIGGDVKYSAPVRSTIPGGVVQGHIRFDQTGTQPDITKVTHTDDAAKIMRDYLIQSLRDVLTLMLLGVIGLRIEPNLIRQPAIQVRRRTIPAIGWGLVTFMLSIPLVFLVIILGLLILLILYFIKLNALTIMVGVGLMVFGSGMIGGFSFLLFFMGRVVISFMIGQLIYRFVLRIPEPGTLRRWITTLGLGTVAYALLTNVPLPALGLIIELITALAGVGAVTMYIRSATVSLSMFSSRSEAPEQVLSVTVSSPAAPPALQEGAPAPGMENLPEGFKGFDDDW